ncbi:fasciclin domain-containing protein [Ascidiimonas sp. W6]|uniref:fasciclin domain-containing protein n=1 Tax=Ascidiimonas meishanensis TaxID=3128903 RepID=UPI0030ED5952
MNKNVLFLALLCLFSFSTFNACTPSDDDFIDVIDSSGDENPLDDDSDDQSDDEETNTEVTLTAYFKANAEYSILSTAIEQIGFSAALDNPSSFTFFAPDNDAFQRYLAVLGVNDVRNISTSVLTQIVQYHMLSGKKTISQLNIGYSISLAKEFSSQGNLHMYLDKVSNTLRINNIAEVTTGNIQATNGTIHKVSEVLGLPTLATFIRADPQFDKLATAASKDSEDTLFELLSSLDTDFTFLAADNDAFDAIVNELEYQSLNDIPASTLATILDNHIHLNSVKRDNRLTDDLMLLMKNNNDVTVTNNNGGIQFIDENQRSSTLLTANLQAWNGVMHVVDKVLLPK